MSRIFTDRQYAKYSHNTDGRSRIISECIEKSWHEIYSFGLHFRILQIHSWCQKKFKLHLWNVFLTLLKIVLKIWLCWKLCSSSNWILFDNLMTSLQKKSLFVNFMFGSDLSLNRLALQIHYSHVISYVYMCSMHLHS